MRDCEYNNQHFFVRVYFLRINGSKFFKVEVVLHSGTLGKGKNYTLEKAFSSATKFFERIEYNATPLCPLDRHLDEYFFHDHLKKLVGAFEVELKLVCERRHRDTRRILIEEFKKKLLSFEKNTKAIAKTHILDLRNKVSIDAHLNNLS